MKKQPEVTEKTREKFMSVFCSLYKTKPIEKITVFELTKLANYNRSTFYQYFTDIYDLLEQLEQDIFDTFQTIENKVVDENLKIDEILIHRIAQLYDEKGEYLSALLGSYGSVRFTEKFKSEVALPINFFQENDEDNFKAIYIQEFYMSTFFSLFRCWQNSDKNLTSYELVVLIRGLLIHGLNSQKDEEFMTPILDKLI